MIGDEEPEQMKRLLVNRLRNWPKAPFADALQREFDVATASIPELVSGYSEMMSS